MRQDPERAADPGLLAELAAAGYVHLRHPMTWESFAALARRLGTIVLQTDIKIDRERVSTALKPEELGFHNDNPEIGVIGWYCAEQDATGGASLLLDTANLAASFPAAELEVLKTIPLRYPDLARHDPDRGIHAYLDSALVSAAGGRHEVYYAPWHRLPGSYDEAQRAALARFEEWLGRQERDQALAIRLAPGEGLLVDNRRMLHGRGAIAPDSRRLLKRVWIRPFGSLA